MSAPDMLRVSMAFLIGQPRAEKGNPHARFQRATKTQFAAVYRAHRCARMNSRGNRNMTFPSASAG